MTDRAGAGVPLGEVFGPQESPYTYAETIERLRAVLQATRDELARWGWGDHHYGAQAQEDSVVKAVALADAVLKETLDG